MISALAFDLDGTLVQTEKLKALSYAKATVELCPYTVQEDEVIESFKQYVGLSRKEVAEGLIRDYKLQDKAAMRMAEFGVDTEWEAFVEVRLNYYNEMLSDPNMIRDNQWSHNVDLLHMVREKACKIGLATMSHREQAEKVLDILQLRDQFDFVATRDDVENGKPDPEIYHLVAQNLGVSPDEFLVIEDSPSGVQAALNAGMQVVAVATPFTKEGLHELEGLDSANIVDDYENLLDVVQRYMDVI